MTDLDGRFSDDSSSISSLTPSQSASQSSGLLTNLWHAGGSAFSVLSRARSVKDELEAVNEVTLPEEVSQLPKIWMFNYPHVKVEWLHKKRKRCPKVDQHGERYRQLGSDDTSLGEYWLGSLCMQRSQTSLYATPKARPARRKGTSRKRMVC
ncbi:hypothetical protein FOCG_17829 [Fusarium oxysporum f. sp. radicis-lycopersici 26381]|nr:hypothetical protein FOCG_17829 [Fusarium oxysporum f. sp. radicis-lycopersici 26381]